MKKGRSLVREPAQRFRMLAIDLVAHVIDLSSREDAAKNGQKYVGESNKNVSLVCLDYLLEEAPCCFVHLINLI